MNQPMRRISCRITNEAMRLIKAEVRRKGKTISQVLNDLIAHSNLAEAEFDPDDANWEGQIISSLAVKNLRVN